jgi:nicotinamidase-related amidase
VIVDATTPYAWPYDAGLDPARTALVVCGAVGPWAQRTPNDPTAEEAVARLRSLAASHGVLVVLVDHRTPQYRPAPDGGTVGSPDLDVSPDDVVVVAAGVDGFYGSALDAVLWSAGRTDLLVCGRSLETTVHSTVRRANDRGYECLTVADACSVVDPAVRAGAISSIEMSGGIFGAVGTTDAVESALSHFPRLPTLP